MTGEIVPVVQPAAETANPQRTSFRRIGLPLLVGTVILAFVLLPLITARPDILNLIFSLFLYVTLSQSWNILAGFAGQINLGHAAFFGIGALVTRTLWLQGMAFPLAFVLGGLASLGFALIIGIPTFRLRGAYFSIGTLALAEVLRITVSNTNSDITSLTGRFMTNYDYPSRYYLALGLAIATMAATYLLLRSRLILGVLAIREDEDAAQATGVHTVRHKLIILAISSFFAGLAGATFAFKELGYYPAAPFGAQWTFDPLLIAFIGGLGSQTGPLFGAVFFVLIQQVLAVQFVEAHQIIFGALFILVVLVLPGGLVDIWTRIKGLISKRRSTSP